MLSGARVVAVLSVILLVAAGCGGGDESSVPEAAPAPDEGISLEAAQRQPPPPASSFSGRAVADGVELTWTASPDVRYAIFRRAAGGADERLARVEPGPGTAHYLDEKARRDVAYEYWVVPENLWAVPGEASPELAIRAP